MAEYGCIRSFGIDNGELGDASQQECFVLGYELALIDAAIESGVAVSKPVHMANKDRIEAQCKRNGREYRFTYCHDDISESWVQFDMAPKELSP